jgi:hypothetical protein
MPSAASHETPTTTLIKSEETKSLRLEGPMTRTSHLSSAVNSLGGLTKMKSLQWTGEQDQLRCFLCKRPMRVSDKQCCDVCNDASASMPLPRDDRNH